MSNIPAYAALSPASQLVPFSIQRRAVGDKDVKIKIAFCGVCHSDLHTARGEWAGVNFPCVPGHEIVGYVQSVGKRVTRYKVGDRVGVGCQVDSCRVCPSCKSGLEQYCESGNTATYNGTDKVSGGWTFGGYSSEIVVDEHFVLRIPDALDLASAGPLLCAGITCFSPLKYLNAGPKKKIAVVGLGGLGHMGVKLARAMDAEVLMVTTSPTKARDATRLGANSVAISTDSRSMDNHVGSCDIILDTVAAPHNLDPYIALLRRDGHLALLGVPASPHPAINVGPMLGHRLSVIGTANGGISETQEMLDFCAGHGITCDIEMIAMNQINEAYERMLKSDVKYRFVIDMATITNDAKAGSV